MEVLQRTANRGSISTGFDIDNSLKVEADNSEYAEYAITSTTDRRNFCFSGWVKRTELVNATDGGQCIFGSFTEGNEGVLLRWSRENSNYYDGIQVDIGQGGTNYRSYTSSLYRDTSAWYHIVLAVNTRENTASDRWKLYVNGEQVTSWAQQQFPTADFLTSANLSGSKHTIGAYETGGTVYGKHCGYFADFHFIDADQGNVTFLPTDFGEYDEDSGIWKPKAYTGSYGTNGFYLDFSDSANLGDDASGNGNNFTENNITAADQATDSPTNLFCTFNPLMTQNNSPTISEGAMKSTGSGAWNQTWGNMGVKNGKWYYEMKATNTSYTGYFGASTTPAEGSNTTAASLMYNTSFMVGEANSIDYYYWQNGSQVSNESTGWGGYSNNDVLGLALDLDSSTKKFYLYKNGSLLNSGGTDLPTNMQDEFVFPLYVQYENRQDELNFGGYTISSISSPATDANGYGTFEYAPPTGYYALCTKNLAEYG